MWFLRNLIHYLVVWFLRGKLLVLFGELKLLTLILHFWMLGFGFVLLVDLALPGEIGEEGKVEKIRWSEGRALILPLASNARHLS